MIKREKAKVVSFNQLGDERGHLVVVEGNKDIPFEIARIFYIYGSDNDVIRGKHANRDSEFVLINVSGKSKVKIDYGDAVEIIELNEPNLGVYIPKLVWKEMYDFTEDSVLLVLSNYKYNPEEYIRNYDDYLLIARRKLNEDKSEPIR
jgi:dTDP-4-dehydrorhamnose 3,5-epimerase-like enzyme